MDTKPVWTQNQCGHFGRQGKFLAASVNRTIDCPAHVSDKSPGLLFTVKKKVNQSHYRPKVPRGFQEVKVTRLRTMAQDGGKVVSLTGPLFTPRKYSRYSFLLEAESTPGS